MISILAKYKTDFRLNTKLALPIMAGQLGQTAVAVADNVMVGKLGATALAAVSFAIALFAVFFVVGMGISFALPPLVSEADGAGDHQSVSTYFKHSLLLNTALSIVFLGLILLGIPLLDYMGQDPDVVVLAKEYLVFTAWSIVPYMIFQAFRCYCDGMSETLAPMIVIITGNALNIVLNYLLIFGHWGFPAMGVEGAALASLIARIVMVIALIGLMIRWKDLWSHIAACDFSRYEVPLFQKLLQLGIPTSGQMFFEVSAFSGAAIITGMISKDAQAAHQVAINLASITFMIITGLAMASTIRVGNQLGKKSKQGIQDAGHSALIQVAVIMTAFAAMFVLLRDLLPLIYIDDIEVVSLASTLLICAAIFQLPDGIQVTAQSALRGLQDVKVPTLVTFVSYWLIGIPFSYISAIHYGMGAVGVWIGLILGLSISAILLTRRFTKLAASWSPPAGVDSLQDTVIEG